MDLATPTVIKTGANSYEVQHGNDAGLYVEFDTIPELQRFETEKEGREVYKDVEIVRIFFPGDKTKVVVQNVTDEHRQRFKRQYDAFKATGVTLREGMPLEQWAILSKSEVAELKSLRIYTVEALAEISDNALTWLGAREYREKAKVWLQQAKDGAVALRLQSENDKLREDIEMLKLQIADLGKLKSKKE